MPGNFPGGIGSTEDSIDGNGSRSLSRPRSNGGGVNALCNGEAVYECAPYDRGGGNADDDWNAGGNEDRFFGADMIFEINGGIVGDRPVCTLEASYVPSEATYLGISLIIRFSR